MSNNFHLLNEIFDDLEKSKVQAFLEDPVMSEAVKKALLCGIYYNGTLKKGKKANPLNNFTLGLVSNKPDLSNEQIGSQLRAMWEGINALELGFSNLALFKETKKPILSPLNKAR